MKAQFYIGFVIIYFLSFACSFLQAQAIDFSIDSNWAVLPHKFPNELNQFGKKVNSDSVDVFYVYPTLLVDREDKRWNVGLTDMSHKYKVISSAVKFQASAWSEAGNMFVPFYRQAHIRSYFELENGGREALLLAYEDVKAAFTYYLEHYNKGKSIVLAGHSQGSTHVSFLLRDFFDGKPLQQKLIAAYIPGIGIDHQFYKTIPLLTQANQTGGFVTWNTFKKKIDKDKYAFYKGRCVINPVTWDTSLIAPRNDHRGFLFSNGKLYTKSFTTHTIDGAVWITVPHFPYRMMSFTMKNYHVGDVNLFWEDIRQNVLLRVQSYFDNR